MPETVKKFRPKERLEHSTIEEPRVRPENREILNFVSGSHKHAEIDDINPTNSRLASSIGIPC